MALAGFGHSNSPRLLVASEQKPDRLRETVAAARPSHAIATQDEGTAIENQFVLTAHLVEVDERQAGFGDTRHGMLHSLIHFIRIHRANR